MRDLVRRLRELAGEGATLAEGQAYRLPSGTIVIAHATETGEWRLLTLREWGEGAAGASYAVAPCGYILREGAQTCWTLADLTPMPVAVPVPASAA